MFAFTRNSPKYVELIGAFLIAIGFLVLGKGRRKKNVFVTDQTINRGEGVNTLAATKIFSVFGLK